MMKCFNYRKLVNNAYLKYQLKCTF